MKTYPVHQTGQVRHFKHIKEPGIYSFIFRSKLDSAKKFKYWVFKEILASIRKTGGYQLPTNNQIMLLNEKDLHYKVVHYIRKYHENAIIIPDLGELQTTIK